MTLLCAHAWKVLLCLLLLFYLILLLPRGIFRLLLAYALIFILFRSIHFQNPYSALKSVSHFHYLTQLEMSCLLYANLPNTAEILQSVWYSFSSYKDRSAHSLVHAIMNISYIYFINLNYL